VRGTNVNSFKPCQKKPRSESGSPAAGARSADNWEKPALLVLVKDLYEAAAENRDFIQARCQTGESGGRGPGKVSP
jgi:hypothetical protein